MLCYVMLCYMSATILSKKQLAKIKKLQVPLSLLGLCGDGRKSQDRGEKRQWRRERGKREWNIYGDGVLFSMTMALRTC